MRNISIEYSDRIKKWVRDNRNNVTDILKEIVSVPSVKGTPLPGMPYGKQCAMALQKGMEICGRFGMESECYSNYAASALYRSGTKEIGFIAHLDVVPVSNDWTTDPFTAIERDGFIVGRGARDDKAGFTAALMALNCIRELEIPLSSSVRIIMGSDEESGMSDMDYYVQNCPLPDFSIVTDCYFPVAHGEKGRICGDVVFPIDEKKLSMEAGTAPNIIPAACKAVLPGRAEEWPQISLLAQKYDHITVKCEGSDVIVLSSGISAHASEPFKALNAIWVMGKFLSETKLLSGNEAAAVDFISNAFSYYYGEAFGIQNEDAASGKTTLITGMVRTSEGKLKINVDSRICVTEKKDRVLKMFYDTAKAGGAEFILHDASNPHYIPKEHPVAQRLTEAFNFITGENKEPYIVAGGTYASHVPNSVAFGPGNKKEPSMFPAYYPKGYGDAHQPDESQNIDCLLDAVCIYALGILELDEIINGGSDTL